VTVGSAALAGLRERLHEMRDDALQQLAEADHLDTGLLALLANTSTVLATIEAEAATAATPALDPASPTHARTRDRRRGGDPRSGRRRQRDDALCDVAALLGADLSLGQRAAEVIARARRYRPAPLDDSTGSAERKALHRLADVGLPLPGRRQLRRILSTAAAGHPSHPLAKQKTVLDVKPEPPLPEP